MPLIVEILNSLLDIVVMGLPSALKVSKVWFTSPEIYVMLLFSELAACYQCSSV